MQKPRHKVTFNVEFIYGWMKISGCFTTFRIYHVSRNTTKVQNRSSDILSRSLRVVKYNVRGYTAYLIKKNMWDATIPIFRSARESPNRFWRELSSYNLKPWPSIRSGYLACDPDASTSTVLRYLGARRPIKKGKIPLKRICRKLHSRLAAKEGCKHLEMAVEVDVYGIGAQRRTREHLHSFVRVCIHFRRFTLSWREFSNGKKITRICVRCATLLNVFSSRFSSKNRCINCIVLYAWQNINCRFYSNKKKMFKNILAVATVKK